MKHINKLSLAILFFIIIVQGCKKDENINYFEGGTAPVLKSSLATNSVLPISFADSGKILLSLSWTNPNYRFTTGISSQNVTYSIEIDSAGKNFSSSFKKVVTPDPTYALSKDIKVSEMNDYLLNVLKFNTTTPQSLEIRVTTNLVNNNAVLHSNVIKYTATPYPLPPKVALPTSNELYITGGATPLSWQCGCASDLSTNYATTQKFTKVGPAQYELASIALTGGQSYLLLPVYGSWSDKFGFTGANNANNVDGDDFKRGGGDIKAPAVSGNYKILVDFQTGRFTLTKL